MRAMLAAALSAMLGMGAAAATRADGIPSGTWIMQNGKVTVRVSNCGGDLCGTIVNLKRPLDKNGKPKLDKENPDSSLRGRPVIGLTILNGLKQKGDGRWEGTIYNPDDGNTYDSKLRLVNGNQMNVKGCVLFICKSMKFNRLD